MLPKNIYFEPAVLDFPLGQYLHKKYGDLPWIPIENHNNIPQFRQNHNREFARMKQNIIIGVRKTHKYVTNHKTSDFLVPYTSSGCSAACLYCYLVCHYNKCSYLRLFVNREQMLGKLMKTADKASHDLTFEIGSNSDLILENTITDNLPWTITEFGSLNKGYLTFPTKFHMVDDLLALNHHGRTLVRMSVNPSEIIQMVEFGTSPLTKRLEALNKLYDAGYPVGLLIAPVVMIPDWQVLYQNLLAQLAHHLNPKLLKIIKIEIIFMTYSYIHRMINQDAFPHAVNLYDAQLMTGRGRGKYCYKPLYRSEGEHFFKIQIPKYFSSDAIAYIV